MRLTTVLFIASLMQLSAATFGQKITLNQQNVPLKSLFKEIRKQSGYNFFYDGRLVSTGLKASIKVADASIEEALKSVLADLPLDYEIKDRLVIITKKIEPPFLDKMIALFQTIDVRGRILDEKGTPLPGATVRVRGTNKIARSDSNGAFAINGVDENAILEISYVGYIKQEVKAEADVLVKMALASSDLKEVTVNMGYYSTTRMLNTGAVSSVTAKDIERQPVSNPMIAIAGRMAGVSIQQNTGTPGGAISIQIRGQNSLRNGQGVTNGQIDNGNLPLYVIDGVPYPAQITSSTQANFDNQKFGSPLSFINPNDIESIDVLKDADATAPYGSRGANGVVLITTKKGKAGKMEVNANVYTGFGKVSRKIKLMNTPQYLEMMREAVINSGKGAELEDPSNDAGYPDLKLFDQNKYTDWQEFFLGGTAPFTNAQLGVSGGTDNVRYLLNSSYGKEGSVQPGDQAAKRLSFNLNLGFNSNNKKLTNNLSVIYGIDKTNLFETDLVSRIYTAPNAPDPYTADGKINWEPRFQTNNPVADFEKKYNSSANNLVASNTLNYEVINGLSVKIQAGYNKLLQTQENKIPSTYYDPTRPGRSRYAVNSMGNETWNFQPQIEYLKGLAGGEFSAIFSATWQQSISKQQGYIGRAFTSDAFLGNISLATQLTAVPPGYSDYRYSGLLGRINYNWKDRYVLNLIARRDGSSRFGTNQKFGNYGSAGANWIFSNEPFFAGNSLISYGKIRVSYGTTGSDQIGDYGYLDSFQGPNFPYDSTTGLVPARIANPLFSWEFTRKMDLAADFGFFQDRLLASLGYFNNKSDKQLVGYPLSPVAGSPTGNIQANSDATIGNWGYEFEVTSVNIKSKNFNWRSGLNLTIPRNELLKFPDIEKTSYANLLVVGEPVFIQKRYQYTGLDTNTGLYTVKDMNGDGVYNNMDQVPVFVGQKFYGGWTNNFTYKGIELDFLLQFVKQYGPGFYETQPTPSVAGSTNKNQPLEMLDSWKNTGDQAKFQRYGFTSEYRDAFSLFRLSDAMIGDASFLRLKNVSLSYTLPENLTKKMSLSRVKIYFQGQNLFTITNYNGFDPEMRNANSLSSLRVLTAGASCSF